MPLLLKHCHSKQEWDSFITSSPQANIFCQTQFLDALGVDYDLLLVEKNSISQLGAIVLRCNHRPISAPYTYSMYQGIFFAGFSSQMPIHRRVKWQLEVIDFLLLEMEKHYPLISLCLHYSIDDLRSFQWFHYHEPQKGLFHIINRYTGIINLNKWVNFEGYLKNIRKVRGYEYRQGLKNKLTVKSSFDINKLDYLHELTFSRQGIVRSKKSSEILKKIAKQALASGFGKMLFCFDNNGRALSATLYLYDDKCAYYLFGATHPLYRQTGSGTFLMLENIRICYEKNIQILDVCGINSPNRGDYKVSFNAVPTAYFELCWKKQERH